MHALEEEAAAARHGACCCFRTSTQAKHVGYRGDVRRCGDGVPRGDIISQRDKMLPAARGGRAVVTDHAAAE